MPNSAIAPAPHPNEQAILDYAASMGVKGARITFHGLLQYTLHGEGIKREKGTPRCFWRPLVWSVADDCRIAIGCYNGKSVQIDPGRFVLPAQTPLQH